MKASTFFALFIAMILFFTAMAGLKYFGFFRAPAPVVERKAEVPKVLAARRNLNQGYAMTPADVMIREVTPYEIKDYQDNPDKYLPPIFEAASFRILNRDLIANQILLKEYLEPMGIPDGPSQVVTPGMKAVHVSVSKDHASGGLIRVHDNVDVYLTCQITGSGYEPTTKIAPIALGVPVIFKRDLLYPMVLPTPENKPLQFTLEVNPYRAALIEFASGRGQITLMPTAIAPRSKEAPKTFNIPSSKEYRNEDERIAALLRGDRGVGDADLERVFNLPPLPLKENIQIVMMKGNKMMDTSKGAGQFTRSVDTSARPPADPDQPGYGYHFSPPPSPAAEKTPSGTPRSAGAPQTRPQQGAAPGKQ